MRTHTDSAVHMLEDFERLTPCEVPSAHPRSTPNSRIQLCQRDELWKNVYDTLIPHQAQHQGKIPQRMYTHQKHDLPLCLDVIPSR